MVDCLTSLNKQLFLSSNKQHLLLSIAPIAAPVTALELTKAIKQSPFAAMKINPNGIKQAVETFAKLNNNTLNQAAIEPITIADRLDAQLKITIDSLKVSAKAEIISAYGGQPITLDEINEKVKELGITHGISKKMLHLLIQKSKKSPPGTLYQAVIAKGEKPVDGKNATFTRLVEIPSERIMKPQVKENGQVDMRELGALVTVSPGTPLMRKTPHVVGVPGITISGEPILPVLGEDIAINLGAHTDLDLTDPNLVIATVTGIPHEIDNGMRVDDALIIENVNVGSGNINYDGDVIIAGDIGDGMKVHTTGNITVAGFIESAHIECAGDLFVGKGILGRKRASDGALFSCEINCQGSVTATFSQYTHMNIGKDLHIKNQLLHCKVYCQGHISVQNDQGNKGVVLGGILSAYRGITTTVLGAPAGTKTLLDLTGIYPQLMDTKKHLESAIPKEKEKLYSVFETQQMIAAAPPTAKRKAIDARLSTLQGEAENALITLEKDQEENLTAIQDYLNYSKVITLSKLYSEIYISIGNEVFHSKKSYGPTCVSIQNEQLTVTPYQQ